MSLRPAARAIRSQPSVTERYTPRGTTAGCSLIGVVREWPRHRGLGTGRGGAPATGQAAVARGGLPPSAFAAAGTPTSRGETATPPMRSRAVAIVLPEATARRLVDLAQERWHHVLLPEEQTPRTTTVQLRADREAGLGVGIGSIGSFTIVWGRPAHGQATITRLSWDVERGSEDAARRALNVLAGWPLARAGA
jgi:hypothetical protein